LISIFAILRKRFKNLFSRKRAVAIILFSLCVIIFGTVAFYLTEPVLPSGQKNTLFLSFYWVMETITTVGYGDIYPNNVSAKIVFFAVIILGIGAFAMLATEASAYIIDTKFLEFRGLHHTALKKHVIVVGYNDATQELITQLSAHNIDTLVIETGPDASSIKAKGISVISGDPLSAETLERAGIADAYALVTSEKQDELAVMVALKAREINPSVKIISTCAKFEDYGIMKDAKIDTVIPVSKMHGGMLANAVTDSNGISFLLDVITEDNGIALDELDIAQETTISSLSLKSNEKPIAIWRDGRAIAIFEPATQLKKGDSVIILRSLPSE
jgi:voltage-gated potassium channel